MKRRWRVLAIVVAVPVVAYVLAVAYFTFVPSAEDHAHRVPFVPQTWRDRSLDQDPLWPTRLRMVDDLIAQRHLDGLSRAQTESLLGPGDKTGKWADWDLIYWLGPERRGMFRIDSEWLVIRLDASGKVARYRIVGD